jgi:putative ABC transport system permease protein
MRLWLNIQQSLDAIRANAFRAGVTIFIIALGITALVVVMTSIDGIRSGLSSSFSALGSNTFRIQNQASQIRMSGRGRAKRFPSIDYRQARAFQEAFKQQAIVSLTGSGRGTHVVRYQSESTNANIQMVGTDENYARTTRLTLAEGRSLSAEDVQLARKVVVLGASVKKRLFPYEPALDHYVNISGQMYRVIGSFASMGSSGISGTDKSVVIPLSTLRAMEDPGSLTLNVYAQDPKQMDYLMSEATGAFRLVRELTPREENNFAVSRSDAFVDQLLDQLAVLTISAQVIALITLLGASVALLNVMLVSVTERTTEIGLRKALGASERNILLQFLMEAIVICQVGGVFGIVLGVVLGNLVANLLFSGAFVVPWTWVIIGLIACFLVGIGSGFYPAWKAARVDPIESLRFA